MGAREVARALELMQDDQIRSRLQSGDFSDLEEAALSDDERGLITEAAADYPDEVEGFARVMGRWLRRKRELPGGHNGFSRAVEYARGSFEGPISLGGTDI